MPIQDEALRILLSNIKTIRKHYERGTAKEVEFSQTIKLIEADLFNILHPDQDDDSLNTP